MATPITTLLVGLGGSGAWTIAHIKRQLYNAYGNRIPENVGLVAIDTNAEPTIKLGTDDIKREEGMGIGSIVLEKYEYAYIGGDSYDFVREIDSTTSHPHIKSWFLASEYLQTLARGQFFLDKGAGQFRQFGRLAIFRDVLTPVGSAIASIIDTKLVKLAQRSPDRQSITVILVGSLTGGTGAGVFLDIPHLVRRVAQRNNLNVRVRGYFYLPGAFQGTLPANEIDSARYRAFASMRELKRFLMNEDYKYGYPMYYHKERSGVDASLWRAKVQGKLYDFVYLIDGSGPLNANAYKIENGVTSIVADAVVAAIDGSYGASADQAMDNLQSKVAQRQADIGKRAFVSALGAFSIILPVEQMIEGWAHQLGLELLGKLLSPGTTSDRGYVLTLKQNANPERAGMTPEREVEGVLTQMTPLTDPRDPTHPREIVPMLLWQELHRMYTQAQVNRGNAIGLMRAYGLKEWLRLLVPGEVAADPQTQHLLTETASILNRKFADEVETSDKRKPRGNPEEDHRDIAGRADRFITVQLGQKESGGGRQGGDYANALNRFSALQVTRLREYLAVYAYEQLNSPNASDAINAKTGKLGWLIATMTEMRKVFGAVIELLETVRTEYGSLGQSQRASEESRLDNGLREMREKAPKRNLVGGLGPATEAQTLYIERVQSYVEFYRSEFAREALFRTALQFRQIVDEMQKELTLWFDLLARDNQSLYTRLADGANRVTNERQRQQDLVNHEVIRDSAWEEERYQDYLTQSEAIQKIFADWRWNVSITEDRVNPKIRFDVQLGSTPFRRDMNGEWARHNSNVLLAYTREIFRTASSRENILDYLRRTRYADNPKALGDYLARRAGYQLNIPDTDLNSGKVPTNVLLAKYDSSVSGQPAFLREVMRQLIAAQNLGDVELQDNPLQKFEQCDDPFRLTLLSTAELVPLEGLSAYTEYKARYDAMAFNQRQQAHIFPAEVRAVVYETALRTLNQSPRILADRVALLLENEDRFIEAMLLLAHKVIFRKQSPNARQGTAAFQWFLRVPDPTKRSGLNDWWLTEPVARPRLLDALITYIIREDDVRSSHPDDHYTNPIPYDLIPDFLRRVQEEDTAKRLERDQLALLPQADPNTPPQVDEELRKWFDCFRPPLDDDGNETLDNWTEQDEDLEKIVAMQVVQHDMMQELIAEFKPRLPTIAQDLGKNRDKMDPGRRHDEMTRLQEEFDLYSVAVLALDEEAKRLRSAIQDRYLERTNQSTWRRDDTY